MGTRESGRSGPRPWTNRMATPRSAETKPTPPPTRKSSARRVEETRRKVAKMLRELQIEGDVLSAEIERLRRRFL
jgi:hypothetical protein